VDYKLVDTVVAPDPPDPVILLHQLVPDHHAIHALLRTLQPTRMMGPETLAKLDLVIARARRLDPAYRPPRFENLLRVKTPDVESAHSVAASLRLHPMVEFAEVQRVVPMPGVMPGDDPLGVMQTHFQPPRQGINVQAMWAMNVDGSGVTIVDL